MVLKKTHQKATPKTQPFGEFFLILFLSVWMETMELIVVMATLIGGAGYAHITITVEGRKEMFYLMTHSIHFIYGYMASDI